MIGNFDRKFVIGTRLTLLESGARKLLQEINSRSLPGSKKDALVKAMTEHGMAPIEAIRAATVTAAEVLGAKESLGSLTPGKYADVIGVADDPLKDIAALERVQFVMKGGKIVRNDR